MDNSRRQRWEEFSKRNQLDASTIDVDAFVCLQTLKMYDELQAKYTSRSILKCKKCASNNVAYESRQLRRADEAETIFCLCRECRSKWRIG